MISKHPSLPLTMSSSNKKSQFLGMPYGTACGQLRKKILWKLVIKCGEDSCYRCNCKIETIEELSIEHKQPWEGVSKELFWDIDNIAFSHQKCNIPHRRPGTVSIAPVNKLSENDLRQRYELFSHLDPFKTGFNKEVMRVLNLKHAQAKRLKSTWIRMGLIIPR